MKSSKRIQFMNKFKFFLVKKIAKKLQCVEFELIYTKINVKKVKNQKEIETKENLNFFSADSWLKYFFV